MGTLNSQTGITGIASVIGINTALCSQRLRVSRVQSKPQCSQYKWICPPCFPRLVLANPKWGHRAPVGLEAFDTKLRRHRCAARAHGETETTSQSGAKRPTSDSGSGAPRSPVRHSHAHLHIGRLTLDPRDLAFLVLRELPVGSCPSFPPPLPGYSSP
jgi:hypothetical protein